MLSEHFRKGGNGRDTVKKGQRAPRVQHCADDCGLITTGLKVPLHSVGTTFQSGVEGTADPLGEKTGYATVPVERPARHRQNHRVVLLSSLKYLDAVTPLRVGCWVNHVGASLHSANKRNRWNKVPSRKCIGKGISPWRGLRGCCRYRDRRMSLLRLRICRLW